MHQDMPVLVGINERGLYIIDNIQAVSQSFCRINIHFKTMYNVNNFAEIITRIEIRRLFLGARKTS